MKYILNKYGALITVLVVSLILFVFFHRIILHANQVSFANGGDGHKSTFGTLYHIQHDAGYWHTGSMNYPYGESVFFTGNQVVLTNTLKLIKDAGWDLSDYALGISNLLILFSFVIASFFIYLIFKELDMDSWLAIPASVLIILLSNQWERLGGHYNLAYAYLIPVILYLLLRFYRKPSYLISVIFGILVILFSAKQLYIAAFILILWVPFWIFLALTDREKFARPWFIISHVLIQFIVPFLLFNLFTGMHDSGLDRTAYPWGFYPSRVRWEAVFLPEGLPHGKFLPIEGPVRMNAYVGLLGSVVALIILGSSFMKLIRGKKWNALAVSGNPGWNILFWAGVVSLLIALGLPFALKWESLLNYTGPFRQLRAVGRFVFPFYYIMTITSFYFLWKWYTSSRWSIKPYVLLLILIFAGFESYLHIRTRPERYHNPINWHSGIYNNIPSLEWLDKQSVEDYQAIIPLPFFHVGSENYWMGDQSPVTTMAYATSLKSGLPLNAVMLSRTSISQTLKSMDLIREPYHDYPLLNDLPDRRPFILLCRKNGGFTLNEKRLIGKGIFLDENSEVRVYRLEVDSISSLIEDRRDQLKNLAGSIDRVDTAMLYMDFSSQANGYFESEFRTTTPFFEALVPDTGKYMVSFWFEGVDRDLWPRTNLITELFRADGSKYLYDYTDFFRKMVLRDESLGLIEYPVHIKEPGSMLKISMRNRVITGGMMQIDQILVQPAGSVHVMDEDGSAWINNRQLKKQ